MRTVAFSGHPTHHILGMHCFSNADPKDNGFQALCFPKSTMPLHYFLSMAKAFVEMIYI